MSEQNEKNSNLVLVSQVYPDNIFVLPLSNRPIFPGISVPMTFSGEKEVKIIKEAIESKDGFLGVAFVQDENQDNFLKSTLFKTGSLIRVMRILHQDDKSIHFFAQVIIRFQYIRSINSEGLQRWGVKYFYEDRIEMSPELKALVLAVVNTTRELVKVNPVFQEQMKLTLSQMGYEQPGLMMDVIASMLNSDPLKLQNLLETIDLYERSEKLLLLLREELQLVQLQEKIQKQIEERVSQQQKEFFLGEQLKVIKKELGLEKDDKSAEIEKLEEKISGLKLSDEAKRVVDEEIEKLKVLEPSSAEYQVTRTYLNVITDLPWGIFSNGSLDLKHARKVLDEQHYGLDDVKQRILEYISTIIKRKKVSGSIICLVGPPGVGKTSIGKSIADALGRKFYRFSVGGMRDEAEIKGHRRTYIGALPGKIIQSLKRTGTSNPVIMLDEIDKIGASFQGDPASALLEVLDPEQNCDFLDHYLDIRYDLSNILFVTTANQLDTIPQPLLDRMEIIKLSGYILEEKMQIAKRYLIPKQREEHGLLAKEIAISDSALKNLIDGYAREAGVRNLENLIKKIMRKATMQQAEGNSNKVSITHKNLHEFVGNPIFTPEELYKKPISGVTLGLAWTAMGGATLYIEAAGVAGNGSGFKQTGQLGKVMQESSEIAFSYMRSLMSRDKRYKSFFKDHFVHLHVPAGATPKDGPSAGITMALALYSLATGKPVKKGIAMTGELTLTGKVLPIGGVREKTIAARRVGVFELIFPKENKRDFDELPEYIREGITPHFVDYFNDVLQVAYPVTTKKKG